MPRAKDSTQSGEPVQKALQSPALSKPSEGQKLPVNKEEVRMLVAAVGYEQAATQTGIKPATLRKWSERYKWKVIHNHKQEALVTTVTSPANALANTLEADSTATRLGFSRAARKVAESLAGEAVERLRMPKEALTAKAWTDVAAKSQKWEDKAEAGINLNVLSIGGDMAIQVNQGQVVTKQIDDSSNSASDT